MSLKVKKEDALKYHQQGQPGKIEVTPTKPLSTQYDLALAYSPGVAEPVLEIASNPDAVYKYTAKGNLVGVISNGTAVLGLGNQGPAASKPVMEGKGVLFKKFAGIDVFDIEVDADDPDEFIKVVKSLEPTFGGINLEDIKAPDSFKVEDELRGSMNIPVMHDDQHGTAIISAAGLLNALILAEKKIEEVKIVVSGAGGSAIASAKLYVSLGAKRENIIMCDSRGVLRNDRDDLNEFKKEFTTHHDCHTLAEALQDADVFLGLSRANVVTPDNLLSMAARPIVFALANPDPEIAYELALSTRSDLIMATGRSDHPNQINNVLGFPYIFRGALDVRATAINEEMKLAAVHALAELSREPVPDMVSKAYGLASIEFGPQYIIPKPLDPRLISTISPAVAKAAMESGVATHEITDWEQYKLELNERIGLDNKFISRLLNRAKQDPRRVVFSEADNLKILQAIEQVQRENIAVPILLGNEEVIREHIAEHNLQIHRCQIMDPDQNPERLEEYAQVFFDKRKRKGVTLADARALMHDPNYFGSMMVEMGHADALVSGLTRDYPKTISPALQTIGVRENRRLTGMYILFTRKGPFFFSDTTVNVDPTAEELVEIIRMTRQGVLAFDEEEPRMAVLSYSNFGSSRGEVPDKAKRAVEMAREQYSDLIIDGDIQANVALNTKIQKENYPFSKLVEKGANTFIFPNLESGNIAYKLVMELGGAEAIGPVLLGMRKPVHVLQMGSSVREIISMTAIAVVHAQLLEDSHS